jgi:hypothetical protein
MYQQMTCGAQRDQVLFGILTTLTPKLLVVNLQIQSASADLASPAITPQHLLAESLVQPWIKPQPRLFG